MHILAAQLNQTIGDFEGNREKIIAVLDRARAKKADIVLFPELAICGYPPEDLLCHASFIDEMEKSLQKIIESSSGLMVIVGLARLNLSNEGKPLFNSAAIIVDGKLLGFYDKWLLPTYDVFDERRYFEPGKNVGCWEYKGKKLGITICEDIWAHSGSIESSLYRVDPIQTLLAYQPDLILNLSASPYHFQKLDTRLQVCRLVSKSVKAPIIMCCQVGGNDQLVFDGSSIYLDAEKDQYRVAKSFQEDDFLIDLEAPIQESTYVHEPICDLYQALILGTRDYLHKQNFTKVCLGLSGGIDSALAASIAVDALGAENVLCVNMPSIYSSSASIKDAEQLAHNLKTLFYQIPIHKPFETFQELLAPYFQEKEVDVTEENLQARIRGNILMALSNKHGYIVLSTGNKSEMALGYCTLYGDMAGGLAILSDLTKGQVYTLARWINREKEVIPISIIEREPSAELRLNQKDSDSLPDYDIVDAVVTAYLENYLDIAQIASRYQIPFELVQELVVRIHKAEYKRRQAPPGIRVSKKAFRVGRCYPIVQKWIFNSMQRGE